MTFEANPPFGGGYGRSVVQPSPEVRNEKFRDARRHSRRVRILRIALPVLAMVAFGLYFTSSPRMRVAIGDLEASVEGLEVSRGNLRMVNPKFEGVTEARGSYTVTAKYAEQAIAEPDLIRLSKIRAELTNPKKGWSRLTAPKGAYHTKTEKLELSGEILAAQSSGIKARLTSAVIDTKTQLIRSEEPVQVDFLNGVVNSRKMEIESDKRRIVFRDQVRVHIRKRPEKTEAPAKK